MREKLQKIGEYLLDVVDSFIVGFVAIMVTLISLTDENSPAGAPVFIVIVFCFLWVGARRIVNYLDRPQTDDAAS